MATSSESSVTPGSVAPSGPASNNGTLSDAERRRTVRAPEDPAELFGFVEQGNAYVAIASGGREWRISRELTGWRLEFRDSGDTTRTNAGVHPTAEAAMREARR